jgi:hypothetical protein
VRCPLLLALLAAAPAPASAAPLVALQVEAPTLHSPMARYSGEVVDHALPFSVGARGDLALGLAADRWLVLDLGGRTSGLDLGRVWHAMVDGAYRESIPAEGAVEPFWEAGAGVELIHLRDHDDAPLALHLGPRFFGGLGLRLGEGRLRPCLGARASFTAATGSFELPDVTLDDEEIERFYMPSVLVLALTGGVSF